MEDLNGLSEDEVESLEAKFGHGRIHVKGRKRPRNPDEAEERPQKKRGSKRVPTIRTNIRTKEVLEMKTGNQDQNLAQNRAPSPFMEALQIARQINTRRPREDQPQEFEQLQTVLGKLDKDAQSNLVFRLVKEVLEDKAPIQGLFPVARKAGMVGVAFNTAALRKAILQGGLSLSDMQEVGLAEIKLNRDNKPYIVYRIGHQSLAEAAPKLRESGKLDAARILEEHLRSSERSMLLAKAARDAQKTNPAETKVEASTEVTDEANETPPAAEKKSKNRTVKKTTVKKPKTASKPKS